MARAPHPPHMTPQLLATRVANRRGFATMQSPGKAHGFWWHLEPGGGICKQTYSRFALHDDCAIVWGACPHGVVGWKPVDMGRVDLRPRRRRAA